jgi:hypothetical protein
VVLDMSIKIMDIVEITDTMFKYRGTLFHQTYVQSDLDLVLGYRCGTKEFLSLSDCLNYINNL